jgi:hypothetical protein
VRAHIHRNAPRDAQIEALLRPHPRRTPPRSEPHAGWLRVHFGSGDPAHADFPFSWLRFHDRRASFRSAEAPDRLDVLASYVDADGRLHVQWEERHAGRRVELSESVYRLDWLRAQAYAPKRCTAEDER